MGAEVNICGRRSGALGSMDSFYASRIDKRQLLGTLQRKNVHVQQAVQFCAGAFVVDVEGEVTLSAALEDLAVEITQRLGDHGHQVGSDHAWAHDLLPAVSQCKLVPRWVAVRYRQLRINDENKIVRAVKRIAREFFETRLGVSHVV